MAKRKKKIFDGVFSQLQQTEGSAVLFDAQGAPSVIFQIENPVQNLCTDAEQYCGFHVILSNILQTVGEGYTLQKQDIFCRQKFHRAVPQDADFLSKSYFKFFEGRPYTEIQTYLIITQEPNKSRFVAYDPKKWQEFHLKVAKVGEILVDSGIWHHKLELKEVNEYVHRFMAVDFTHGPFSMNNFSTSDTYLRMGDTVIRSFPLVDIDEVNLPGVLFPYTCNMVNGYPVSQDLVSFLSSIPETDCVIYNQVLQVPNQRTQLHKLQGKAKKHAAMPDPSNKIAQADIEAVLDKLAVDSNLLVYCNFNIIVACDKSKIHTIGSYIENRLFAIGILPSKSAYNQLELFIASFPGNGYRMNPEYDLFLTLGEAALCLCFKERFRTDEITPLSTYYTDRQGLPIKIDITGKEGRIKMTDNSNFFCIGPSGSGKSFHMNSVVRQLIEQDTDVVMVDTGDSYEGICGYFNGIYISYSKEKPISMNPFKVTKEEYEQNFGEKKNFLKSLLFVIFKGDVLPSKIEDTIVNQVIVEYYEAYFNPFTEFTEEERADLKRKLIVSSKIENPDYVMDDSHYDVDTLIDTPETATDKVKETTLMLPSEMKRLKLIRQCRSLKNIIEDEGATLNEKQTALRKLETFKDELRDTQMTVKMDRQIDRLQKQKQRLQVKELSFNTFYEFAMERIPQIMSEDKIDFDIRAFAAILKQFYRGGEQEVTLNADMDINLFDERFIVFEIDKIKDDPILFPIVVLIIMDVFIQKMRIKKGRKALIIEEAWKAIASPTMAENIKYLYKTVRKFHGIAGVVTQELNDVIDSPIVKEAIINNSDIKILLDQTKFKDRYDDISRILGLTDVQKQQIFTINALQNKEGRNYFKEVWICRGQNSDVYGVEEPPECYWAYTTERAEKEALKIYIRHFGNIQNAITHIEIDRKKKGISKYLDFANLVNRHNNIMELWEN